MTKRSHADISNLEKIRVWIKNERNIRGWSARKLSDEAHAAAKRRNQTTDISQQAISSFEIGHKKTLPRWVPYAAAAFEDYPAPESLKNFSFKCEKEHLPYIPPETDLRKILLGLLAPMEVNLTDAWSLKQQIAASLAKKLPIAITQPQLYADN